MHGDMDATGDMAGAAGIVVTVPPVAKMGAGGVREGQRQQHPSGHARKMRVERIFHLRLSTPLKDIATAMALALGRTATLQPPPLRVRLQGTRRPQDKLAETMRRMGSPIPKHIRLITMPPATGSR
jgi:hypothetical protein